MLNLYSIFVHYVLFFQKKLPPLPPIFQQMWGGLPTLPPSETASAEVGNLPMLSRHMSHYTLDHLN